MASDAGVRCRIPAGAGVRKCRSSAPSAVGSRRRGVDCLTGNDSTGNDSTGNDSARPSGRWPNGSGRLFGVVAAAGQRTGFDVADPQRFAELLALLEFAGVTGKFVFDFAPRVIRAKLDKYARMIVRGWSLEG